MWQLKLMLHALGHYRPDVAALERGADSDLFDPEIVAAVDAFRRAEGLATRENGGSPPGLVDADVVERSWAALERAGKANALRAAVRDATAVRR